MDNEVVREQLLVGVDVGSTTTKIVALNQNNHEMVYSEYRRHNASQLKSVREALGRLKEKFHQAKVRIAFSGSGAKPIAELIKVPFIQEVVANSIALKKLYQNVGTAIELGGQDAKIIFFQKDEKTDDLNVSDMRMNGSCAGGTGAFIDEIATLLKVPVEQFDEVAKQGKCVYDISGRCGVYAKTDIQPLLNQGAAKSDLALSTFHAIAKQTIGGLAQGLDIQKPVAFEGGPLTFNTTLVDVFKERLQLTEEDVLLPEQPEIMIAFGAALSLETMFAEETMLGMDTTEVELTKVLEVLNRKDAVLDVDSQKGQLYFDSKEEYLEFKKRHAVSRPISKKLVKGEKVQAYLGIDSGSTTTKFVLMNPKEEIIERFYASNEGDPLTVVQKALIEIRDSYKNAGVDLEILAVGTTGYGEMLFAKAFDAESHTVETVAHARAVEKYIKDATFILDIGGQDMKAMWLQNGIMTNIVLNEACSSGCGSFLENFAASLHIPVEQIASMAFSSKNPAVLGSRCTVFMNSSIITEQRNGKTAEDIMAGLCRSIIENVFTKVIRVSNLDSLGDKIVVQGGTFANDAVLRAMEQYIGRNVIRAPYPGIMGAIGAALICKEQYEREQKQTFIGLDALDDFYFTQKANDVCPFCMNHCKRTIVTFSNGKSWVMNNRCEKGEVLGNPKDASVKEELKRVVNDTKQGTNLFEYREKLLFKDYFKEENFSLVSSKKEITIGIPRVLSFWETMPFWTTFWKALGYNVRISDKSTRTMYENGLHAVTSDTVCFPAKLVHGHIRNLADYKVDRIFMPTITIVTSENKEKTSESMCAVVKGYPIVLRNSDNPTTRWGIPFDAPLFHWYKAEDRNRQLSEYMEANFGIKKEETIQAIQLGDKAQNHFAEELKKEGQRVIDKVKEEKTYAVVLASRPYQNDNLVNHELAKLLTSFHVDVLTVDSLPEIGQVDLSKSRLDIVNNYHARMLSSAILAAQSEYLEYVQIVSFGCGHDAYLSDEIVRMMQEISGKAPLILKVDESDIQGPLRIRVRSFLETINLRRNQNRTVEVKDLPDPYPVKFTKADKKEKLVLVPNTSHAFCRVLSAVFSGQGVKTVPLEIGEEEAIRLGKQYVHNDICFPAQIVIGEIIAELRSGKYDDKEIAVAMAKYVGDCRLTHYSALLRKALDDAGYAHVPIITNDDVDYHNMHPGFQMNLISAMRIAFALPMIDILEELLRKIRPYEKNVGSTDKAFEQAMDEVIFGLQNHGIAGAKAGFQKAIEMMKQVEYDRTVRKPQVLIVGEYLLNFHPGANHHIEEYLEKNGFEIIEARMTDVIRKTYFYKDTQIKEYHLKQPVGQKVWYRTANTIFDMAHDLADSIAESHPLYEKACRMQDLVKDSDPIIHHTFDAGEGVLIPGEILHHAKHGCRSFVILQPFGCLPNHVVGRGITKKLKELYPDAQILPLDYDPDVSFANVENRLQMLIMNVKK